MWLGWLIFFAICWSAAVCIVLDEWKRAPLRRLVAGMPVADACYVASGQFAEDVVAWLDEEGAS